MPNRKSPDDVGRNHPKRAEDPDAKCPHHPSKERREMVRRSWDEGWWCAVHGNSIRCYPPDTTIQFVKVPLGPMNSKGIKNLERQFARAGLSM